MRHNIDWTRFDGRADQTNVPETLKDTVYTPAIKYDSSSEDWERAIVCVNATDAFHYVFPTLSKCGLRESLFKSVSETSWIGIWMHLGLDPGLSRAEGNRRGR